MGLGLGGEIDIGAPARAPPGRHVAFTCPRIDRVRAHPEVPGDLSGGAVVGRRPFVVGLVDLRRGGYPGATGRFGGGIESDAVALRRPPCHEEPFFDPRDHRGTGGPEPLRDVGGRRFARPEHTRGRDAVGTAQDADRSGIEGPASPREVTRGVQLPCQHGVLARRPEPSRELHGGRSGPTRFADLRDALGDELVGAARVPSDADRDLGRVGIGEDSDVGDKGPEQAFAVAVARSGGRPERGQVGYGGFELRPLGNGLVVVLV